MPHIHEKIDYAGDMYVVNEGAVLLRMHEKYHMWLVPGGHVELDEDFFEAAMRETKEETGLDVTLLGEMPDDTWSKSSDPKVKKERELPVPRFINRHDVSDTHEHVSFVYFGTSKDRDIKPAPGEATEGFKWFTHEELDDPQYGVVERVRHYAHAALEAAGVPRK